MDMKNTIRVFIIFCKAVIISIQLKTFFKKRDFLDIFEVLKTQMKK
jgi:hypothetical protein